LNQANEIGTIEVGKKADLLLVNSNPLDDIDALKAHCGVMVKGQWMSREECSRILGDMKQKYR
jgi:imidazolonepropionase-like amidohydrolase